MPHPNHGKFSKRGGSYSSKYGIGGGAFSFGTFLTFTHRFKKYVRSPKLLRTFAALSRAALLRDGQLSIYPGQYDSRKKNEYWWDWHLIVEPGSERLFVSKHSHIR